MAEDQINEDEFLNSWFPQLDNKSYIIPVAHLDFIRANTSEIADVPIGVLTPNDVCKSLTDKEIKERDETHKIVHNLFTQIKDHTAKDEVMVMMTQARSSMYNNIIGAVRPQIYSLEDIQEQRNIHSDLVIVNKERGVLVGVIQSVFFADPSLARRKLEESVTYLSEAVRIVREVVRTVPGCDEVDVHKTLILSNITKVQLERNHTLQNTMQQVPCLCNDEMVGDENLQRWWDACWPSKPIEILDIAYRRLVARFAIPATRVEIYLTTQPRLQLRQPRFQLKHERDVVNAVGDVHGAEVFQAGLHQLSLFPTQAELLDFDYLDNSDDDVKFLWGPPGTGKTILLVLRALHWIKYFKARNIFILQTKKDWTAASCLVEYQLQQTLNAQQQSSTETQSTQCTFTHIDMSGMWNVVWNDVEGRLELIFEEGWKKKLYTELGLQQRGPLETAIHIVADEAHGDPVAAVYEMLKEEGVRPVRLWAAGVEAFQERIMLDHAAGDEVLQKRNIIPAALQDFICHVTHPLRCPGPVVQEVNSARQIHRSQVPQYDTSWHLTGGPSVEHFKHSFMERDGHTRDFPWRCCLCANNIAVRLQSLRVGEADRGLEGFSANDVFILGREMDCGKPDDDVWSPAPFIRGLQEKGYSVRTLHSRSTRNEVMAVVRREVRPPAITVCEENCVWGLERKIVVYCEAGRDADRTGRLSAFSRTTSLLIYINLVK